jgi:hypothetical protein
MKIIPIEFRKLMNEQIVQLSQTLTIPIGKDVQTVTIPNDQDLEKAHIYGLLVTIADGNGSGKTENEVELITRAEAASMMIQINSKGRERDIDIPLRSLIIDGKPYVFYKFYTEGFSASKSKITIHDPLSANKALLLTFVYDEV